MEIRFDGKVAIVTAGAAGIGEAVAEEFSKAGATVVIADVNDDQGEGVAERLRNSGAKTDYIHTDMTRDSEVASLIKQVTMSRGRLDVLVNVVGNVAGGDQPGIMLHEETEQQWDGTIAVSLKSTFLGMKHAIAYMMEHGGGAIVNIASVCGLRTDLHGTPAYAAAKAGVVHLTRVTAVMYGKYGVRVNAVAPGLTLTRRLVTVLTDEQRESIFEAYPIPRLSAPSEQASAVLWLASDHAAMVTGHTLPVDGGHTAL